MEKEYIAGEPQRYEIGGRVFIVEPRYRKDGAKADACRLGRRDASSKQNNNRLKLKVSIWQSARGFYSNKSSRCLNLYRQRELLAQMTLKQNPTNHCKWF